MCAVTVGLALQSYTKVIQAVSFENGVASELGPLLRRDRAGGLAGRWVGTTPRGVVANQLDGHDSSGFSGVEQGKVIFAIGEKPAKQFIKYAMLEWAVDKLKAMCCAMVAPDDVVFKVVQLHVLFPFHPFASFAFHTDKASMRNSQAKDLGATVIINLGPDESAMQIAGAPPTTYKFPGDMKMFDAIRAWHCSRWSTERTVKIALFVTLTRVADGTNMDLTSNDLLEAEKTVIVKSDPGTPPAASSVLPAASSVLPDAEESSQSSVVSPTSEHAASA